MGGAVLAAARPSGTSTPTARGRPVKPRAVVFRGKSRIDASCAEAAYQLIKDHGGFTVEYARPGFDSDTLKGAALYVQPGGGDVAAEVLHDMGASAVRAIRDYVAAGGRYLGLCLGAYLAGPSVDDDPTKPGIGLVRSVPQQFLDSDASEVIPVIWLKGQRARIYYQAGPYFSRQDGSVLATYAKNGAPAAVITRFGSGTVCLVGPHPEADESWYEDEDLDCPQGAYPELGLQLIDKVMAWKRR
ncbi:BPL-N domain-containing protein [Streptomyces sp. NPDC020192]|uniref:BPL-N domain-containing protein n=1 Tax=Streptomyces sp. NPDC020192 TaxID=3365066 RepID=UPI0037B6477B